VKLSDVQAVRIGEYLLAVYAMLTSSGDLVPKVELHFRAHPTGTDTFTRFRTETKDIGPRLLEGIAALAPSTKPLPGARLLIRKR
jgi:hypothetical protein